MAHEQHCLSDLALNAHELVLNDFPVDRVNRAKWFVHQHDGRVCGKHSRNPNSLLLTT
ncbi:hypothetical protein D3C72_2375830 [compost metagenome]